MLFPILVAYRWWQKPRPAASWLVSALLFIVPYGLYILWRYSTYGYPLPNTAYLKLNPSSDTIRLAAEWLLAYFRLRPIFTILLIAGLSILLRQGTRVDPAWRLSTLVILAFVGFVLFSGRDWMPHHRFLVPIIPLFGLCIGKIFTAWSDKRILLALQALTVISILFEIGFSLSLYRPLTVDFGRYADGQIQAGKRIRETTSPDDTIAIVDAGAIAYYSERRTIDILGLNNEHIAHALNKSDTAYVLSQEPVIIQLHAPSSSTGELLEPIEQGTTQEITSHPRFKECYVPDINRPPDPYYPYLFFRRCP